MSAALKDTRKFSVEISDSSMSPEAEMSIVPYTSKITAFIEVSGLKSGFNEVGEGNMTGTSLRNFLIYSE
jgi:hypothetical protein